MKLGIVGWYGTDTLGDRAILDGILAIVNEIEKDSKVYLGSIFSFYSKRTLLEERDVFRNTAPGVQIELFDMKDKTSSEDSIKNCDLVVVGGGPLMDIEELFLVEKCFKIARRNGIPTAVVGCGIGPLKNVDYRECVKRILLLSDAVFVRDELSIDVVNELYGDQFQCKCLGDPAIISIENYSGCGSRGDYLAINFRDYPKAAYSANSIVTDDNFREIIEYGAKNFEKVSLVPMHTFCIGGDDRKYLAQLAYKLKLDNVSVIHKPMNLWDLYEVYSNATACIGMRYHSVVMQTILNGNNVVLNYTDSKKGKISGFLNLVDSNDFYTNRVINLQDIRNWDCNEKLGLLKQKQHFVYKKSTMLEEYVEAFNILLK